MSGAIGGTLATGRAPSVDAAAFDTPYPESGALARARIALTYRWRHGRWPQLAEPARFTEYVQHRKLAERDRLHVAMTDKLAARAIVADTLGREWLVPLLWHGPVLPDAPPFGFPAMLKTRHGCNQYLPLMAAPDARSWRALAARTRRWTRKPYGGWLDEWSYADVPRGLLAETLLGDGTCAPIDYKVYVFGGRATHVQVHLGRGSDHRWILHDRDWRQLVAQPDCPRRPDSLDEMLAAAERLGEGHAFVRVDFYEIDGRPLFGEFCLYPGSGLDPFAAPWIDFELGRLWRAALSSPAAAGMAAPAAPDHRPVGVLAAG